MNQDLIDRAEREFNAGARWVIVSGGTTVADADAIATRIRRTVIRDRTGDIGLEGSIGAEHPVTYHHPVTSEPTMQVNVTFAPGDGHHVIEVKVTGAPNLGLADRIALLAIGEPCSVNESDGVRTYKPNRLIDWKPVVSGGAR